MSSAPFTEPTYQAQLTEKIDQTKEQFALEYLDVFASPISSFRMRAEFKIWHENNHVAYAMYQPGEYKKPYIVETFPEGSTLIQTLMPRLLVELNANTEFSRKLFQAEFLTSLSGESLITLIYHRPLDDKWMEQAHQLATNIGCQIIGRSRKQKEFTGRDWIMESLVVNNQNYRYQQIEASFTQPNANVCEQMLNWAHDQSQNFEGDLLELYCGNGNFTLPLSKNFRKVLATEISKTSIRSALYNCKLNNVSNIEFVRLSSEELTEAMQGVRSYRRLAHLNTKDFQFSTVFVDPPRAGLDPGTLTLVGQFENILYISCNPNTLQANLETLEKTHTVETVALFDQFPYTPHREMGVVLKRKLKPGTPVCFKQ